MNDQQEPKRRPNVVLIMADQLRADHVGFGGNTVVRTPNLDRIAERGARFDRAYVANPICMPNRASLLTSRVPSAHGTRFNGIPVDPDANTFVRQLRAGGYRTMLVGKAHFQNLGNRPDFAAQLTAGDLPTPGIDRRREPGWDRWEDVDLHSRELVEMPADYYGFDRVELALDHADYAGGHYEHWLRARGFDPANRGVEHAKQVYAGWDQVYQPEMPEDCYPTAWVGERSAAMIAEAAADDAPFFIQCSFPDPHHPFSPPGRFYDMYDPDDIPLPDTFDDPHTDSWQRIRDMVAHRGEQRGSSMSAFAPSAEQFREAAAREYGAITFIDEAVGAIVEALESAGVLDDTVVVVTSDHGDMFGDHGLMLKMGLHYDGCVRVPLVFSGPGVAPSASRSLVSSLDVGPTILDLADVEQFQGMQGIGLTGLFDDSDRRVRSAVYIEEDQMFDAFRVGRPTQMRTAITADARITVLHGSDDGELYDLAQDPDEMHNRWHDPAFAELKARMLMTLMQAQMEHTDTTLRPTAMA
ncbi:sulfatase family protein [Gordonia neofelifaecis]|uniref:Putative sulfatase family protein n=1 Tax=Gordonia neofelifaecis NRRL B-59395 TaxID=644548 RepID=F1YMD2_9ACTN|nr:sulfatase-like hydrolase/transferase [Gordonia neofelifaecis]EGD54181.1 putative sulfatase family protein [Gordonia neofelifaecis NRRL B-59395]